MQVCAQSGDSVKRLIICKDVDEKPMYDLRMVQDVAQARRYTVDFELSDVN